MSERLMLRRGAALRLESEGCPAAKCALSKRLRCSKMSPHPTQQLSTQSSMHLGCCWPRLPRSARSSAAWGRWLHGSALKFASARL